MNDVEKQIFAWNDRKHRFTPQQIALAVDVLTRNGWVCEIEVRANA